MEPADKLRYFQPSRESASDLAMWVLIALQSVKSGYLEPEDFTAHLGKAIGLNKHPKLNEKETAEETIERILSL